MAGDRAACERAFVCCEAVAATGMMDARSCAMFRMSTYPIGTCHETLSSYAIVLRSRGGDPSVCVDPDAPVGSALIAPEREMPFTTVSLNGNGSMARDVTISAGGPVRGMVVRGDCRGTFPVQPQIRVEGASAGRLQIAVSSGADTTLLVRSSRGEIACDDDSGGGLDPLVRLVARPGETYAVFVGVFGGGSGLAEVHVRHLDGSR